MMLMGAIKQSICTTNESQMRRRECINTMNRSSCMMLADKRFQWQVKGANCFIVTIACGRVRLKQTNKQTNNKTNEQTNKQASKTHIIITSNGNRLSRKNSTKTGRQT